MWMKHITNIYVNINENLLNNLINLRKSTCEKNVNKIIVMEKFQISQKDITAVTSMQSHMTVMLLKDINLLLSFITAACERNIDLHLQYQRQFLKLTHVFDHINYSHWRTYQHVYLIWSKKWCQPTRNWKQLDLLCHGLVAGWMLSKEITYASAKILKQKIK